jgi:DNA helicase-4
VNDLQVELLKLMLKDDTQLFCVGDDWQSIYSFRGAVVDYIIDFKKHFPDSETIILNYNYRSTHTIVEAGNEVIKNNKRKIDKSIVAFNREANVINLFVADSEEADGLEYVMRRIGELNAAGLHHDDILVLGRRSAMLDNYRKEARKRGLNASFRTIHSSKGLEARVVFIVGLREGQGGFPDLWMQDRIFQMIREQKLDVMKEEERRLFYVAITRARQELNLITVAGNESSFLKEIPESYLSRMTLLKEMPSSLRSCPACGHVMYEQANFCGKCGAGLG